MPKAVAFQIVSKAEKPKPVRKIDDLTLSDYHGNEYVFEVYPKCSRFDDFPCVYAFIKRGANQHGPWRKILYIGETESLKRRQTHSNHHKLSRAKRCGMTHICVHQTIGLGETARKKREKIEKNLRAKYNPPLNG